MSDSWELESPGRFTVGAMGEPGHRVFYFQAFGDGIEIAVKCEKQQAIALVEHLERLIDDLPDDGTDGDEAPAIEALPPADLPWVVGSISIGIDRGRSQVVVHLEELLIDEEGEVAGNPAHLRVHLRRLQVRSLAKQVAELDATSRPRCRLCEQPIDPTGHACPRLN